MTRVVSIPRSPKVLEEQFDVVGDAHASRVQVSERRVAFSGWFNTIMDPLVREVTVSAPELRFDGTVGVLEALLMTRDMTRITLIADVIRIEKVLRWKGAEVEIHARRLVFRDSGRIDTTPESFKVSARAQTRNEQGHPVEGTTIRAAHGQDGNAGGNITLHIAELDCGNKTGVKRFVTDGAPGQLGEKGGTLPFVPRTGGPPTKDVQPVTLDQAAAAIIDKLNSTPDLGDYHHWRTGGGLGRDGINATWAKLITEGDSVDRTGHTVTDLRIGLVFQKVFQMVHNEVRIPSHGGGERWTKAASGVDITKAWERVRKLADPWTPSDGENAYPSGTTGRGGNGGILTVPAHISIPEGAFSCTGGLSELSPYVQGGAAGKPQKYLVGAFRALQHVMMDDLRYVSSKPTKQTRAEYIPLKNMLEVVAKAGETQPGQSAEGSMLGPGDEGRLVHDGGTYGWMEPRLVRIVADHARELYGAGHRERAWERLKPYWLASREPGCMPDAADTRSALTAVRGMVENFQQNLNLYGHPPGWVPRFSASSYLQAYLADRQFSYRFVAVMEKAIALMSSAEHANAMLDDLSGQTEQAIERLHDALAHAFARYDKARQQLDDAQAKLAWAQRELDAIEEDASVLAIRTAHDQAVAKAVFGITASVLKAVPVYQPAFAGIGAIVESVGTVVADTIGEPQPPDDEDEADADGHPHPTDRGMVALNLLDRVGRTVAKTVKDNGAAFRTQFQDARNEQDWDKLNPDTVDLRKRVDQLKLALATAGTDSDAAIRQAHDQVLANEQLADLLSSDDAIARRLADFPRENDDLLRQLQAYNAALAELATQPVSSDPLKNDIARGARQRLLLGREKLLAALGHAQDRIRELENTAGTNATRRQEIQSTLDAVQARRKELEDKREQLDKLLPGLDKKDAEKAVKDATNTFGKVLDGVERIATGAAEVASAIRDITTQPDPESAEVQALRKKVLEGPMGKRYAKAQEEVQAGTHLMNEALVELMSCSQQVQTVSADFTSAIQTSIDIARNRVVFSRAVDTGLRASLVSMQRQARERMDYYLYLFRRAYMYEYCTLPGSDLGRLNHFIAQLDTAIAASRTALAEGSGLSKTNPALAGLAHVIALPSETFATIGDDALRNTLAQLAVRLLDRRQARGGPTGSKLLLPLAPEHLEELATNGRVDIARAIDLMTPEASREAYLMANPLLRITSLQVVKAELRFRAEQRPMNSMRIVVTLGQELPLWDGKQYFVFRIGSAEKPVTYAFGADHFDGANGVWQGDFEADTRAGPDDLFTTVMAKASGTSLQYSELNPSFLASLHIAIVLGAEQITGIESFRLAFGIQSS